MKSAEKKRSATVKTGERQARSPVSFQWGSLSAWVLPVLVVLLSFVFMRSAKDPTLVRLPVAAAATAGVFLFFGLADRPLERESRPALYALGGYLACALAAAFLSFFPAAGPGGMSRILVYAALLVAAAHLPISRLLIPTWLACGLVLCVMALLDAHRAEVMVYLPLMERGMPRFVTPLGNRNFFAGFLALAVPPGAALCFRQWYCFFRQGTGRREKKFFALTGTAAGALVLFFLFLLVKVGSRAALGGALFGFLVFLLLAAWFLFGARRKRRLERSVVAGAVVAVFLLSAWFGVVNALPVVRREIRQHIFSGTLRMIRTRPVFGYGPGAYLAAFQQFRPPDYYDPELGAAAPVSDQSHNEFMQVAAETGLLSLAFFVLLLVLVFRSGWRALGRHAAEAHSGGSGGLRGPPVLPWAGNPEDAWFLLAGFLAGAAALLADGMLSSNLRTHTVGPLFWVTLGLCLALATRGRVRPDPGGQKADRLAPVFWFAACVLCFFAAGVLSRQVTSRVYHNRGIYHRHRENWRAASWYYRRALEMDPSYIQAYYRLGLVLHRDGNTREAISAYRRLVEISPNFAMTYANLANMYLAENDPENALVYLEKSLEYNPHDEGVLRMKGYVERRLERSR